MRTHEEIQAVTDHMIRMANYPKTGLSIRHREKFRKELDLCLFWLLQNGQTKNITDSIIDTNMEQAEEDGKMLNIKNFLGI